MSNVNGTYEVYKKWRKGGFATFSYWADGGRVIIDIGDVNTTTNKATSSTKCYVQIDNFMAYLHAEMNGQIDHIYPTMKMTGMKHGITWYGGTTQARVFKIEDWNFDGTKPTLTPSEVRRFKCGLFEKLPGGDGTQPDFKKKISMNSIQMKPFEIAALYQALSVHYNAYVTAAMQAGTLSSKVKWEKPDDK